MENSSLLYSNGCRIYLNDTTIIENGDSISYSPLWRYCPDDDYVTSQGVLLLTWPGDDDNRAVLLHNRIFDDLNGTDLLHTSILFENGQWRAMNKNISIYTSDRLLEYLSAVRHANGRDWWIVTTKGYSNVIVTCLFTRDGIEKVFEQTIGPALLNPFGAGQGNFSADGNTYIRMLPFNGLYIYDFDRCTGQLSNPIFIQLDQGDSGGCATSADSRFLYIPNNMNLYQFDLTAENIPESILLVGEYDGFRDPFPTTFYQAALAPDGKIYMSCSNGVRSMHVIHHPERKGISCDFRQHDLHLPVHYGFTVPNFPNYRLGPIDGSPCDTLGINNVPVAEFRYEFDTLEERLVHFRNTSAFEPTDFHWTYGDGHASLAFEKSHLYYRSDTYRVCLTASNKYGSDTFCRDIPVQLSQEYDPADLPEFIIAPNPVNDYLRISFNNALASDIDFELCDSQGRLVRSERLLTNTLDHFLDLSSLTTGLYFYRLDLKDGKENTGKLIKT